MKAKFVNEAIKHLTPKSKDEVKASILELPVEDRLAAAVAHDVELSGAEIAQYEEEMRAYIMQHEPRKRLKLSRRTGIELSPEDLEKTEYDLIKYFQTAFPSQTERNKQMMHKIKWGDADFEYLIRAGADVNYDQGRPLRAAINTSRSMIKTLLKYGADPTLKDGLAIKMVKNEIKDIEKERDKENREYFTTYEEEHILKYKQILKLFRDYESKISK